MNKDVSFHTLKFMCDLAENLRPKENMTISEWAEKYMILPEGSSEAGRYSTKSAPYQKRIMDVITDPKVVQVALMASSQVGKTLIELCGICYYIDYEPATQMLVIPTIADAEKFSKTRLAQTIEDIPRVREKVADPKARNSNNTIKLKSYPGGTIAISGANSPSSLASDPRRIIWMDEVDRFPDSAGTEGNPIKLAEKRSTHYWNKKHILLSTPTIAGHSNIEDAYNEGSMEEWCVACPECGEFQPYSWRRVDFAKVAMVCEKCGCIIPERRWKESEHKWIAQRPERKKKLSFHLNEMASPVVDWSEMIDEFKSANEKLKRFHDTKDLKVFINTSLGEVWKEEDYVDDMVDQKTIESRAESYDAQIPEGVIILTAAVDVQDNRFEIEIKGWAREHESWGIEKVEIYGDLYKPAIWDELEEYLDQTLKFADGRELKIAGFAIDTGGHHTNSVYKFVKRMKSNGKKCFGIKGYAGKPDAPLLYKKTAVDITEEKNGKKYIIDHTLINIIGVDSGKEDITNWLKIEEPGPGYCHFPDDVRKGYGAEYYEGLTSEYQTTKEVNGKYKKVWKKKDGVRNEPFDLFNYNYAVVELLRPDWDVLEDKLKKGINYMIKKDVKKSGRRTIEGIEV